MRSRFYSLKLTLLCIVVFILQVHIRGFTELFLLNKQALYGEWWRFVTAIFLHGSLSHLISNLFALALFGFILESIVGSKKFLALFFVSGIGANLVAVHFYGASLGASGAIYGIIGALAILRPLMLVWAFGMPLPMIVAAFFWAMLDVAGLFVPSNIGHVAHLSGMAFGFVFGFVWLKKKRKLSRKHALLRSRREMEIPESYMRAWEERYLR